MILVDATFIGKDGSMGYKKGQRYQLLVSRKRIRPILPNAMLSKRARPRPCPYNSIESFLKNWSDISYFGEIVHIAALERLVSGTSSL